MVVTTKQNKPKLKVSIDNNPIKQSHHIKYLGVLIDDNLNWKQQIKEQCSIVARGSWALNQLKHFVDEQTLRSVYHCLIYLRIFTLWKLKETLLSGKAEYLNSFPFNFPTRPEIRVWVHSVAYRGFFCIAFAVHVLFMFSVSFFTK